MRHLGQHAGIEGVGLGLLANGTSRRMPAAVFGYRVTLDSPNTATSKLALPTSIPTAAISSSALE
jgi:hypothetical protein